jgi:ubiquinone/menaquinone biosynthesis C-methylase UbiE
MPHVFANLIDNPIRRKFQPPDATAIRHGIMPGMKVLEIGPGSGRYTLAAATRVGEQGRVVTVDIEPRIIEDVQHIIDRKGIGNIEARIANVYNLPYQDETFDLIYMIAVIGEIPDPLKAIKEFHRVLAPSGTLVFSELFTDPDYPRSHTLLRWAMNAGFKLKKRMGSFLYYTIIFVK